MKESQRIQKLFKDLYNGSPWLDITIAGTLQNITATQVSKKISTLNTVWEIVNHLISWRENILKRVQGNVISTPQNNYFSTITDISEDAWQNTLKRFEDSQQKWILFLDNLKEEDFEKIYPNNNLTYYEHIYGILQHDAYHLGQIVLIKKLL